MQFDAARRAKHGETMSISVNDLMTHLTNMQAQGYGDAAIVIDGTPRRFLAGGVIGKDIGTGKDYLVLRVKEDKPAEVHLNG